MAAKLSGLYGDQEVRKGLKLLQPSAKEDKDSKKKNDPEVKPQNCFLLFGRRHLGGGSWEKASGMRQLGRHQGEGGGGGGIWEMGSSVLTWDHLCLI